MQFDFGSNWQRFLALIDDERIDAAKESLCSKLGMADLRGTSFLDAGCGSGLFSLAATQLGAQVVSFDSNPRCVACAEQLKKRFVSGASNWRVEQASVLDETYLNGLDQFDIVYSWGVLHHTGDMKKAIDLVAGKVKPQGILFIAIYNDQGAASDFWRGVKRLYNRLPDFLRFVLVVLVACPFELKRALVGHPYKKERGMSRWYDWVDWCGGYPFEVAKPSEIVAVLEANGFKLENLTTTTGWGCNEFVFRRDTSVMEAAG